MAHSTNNNTKEDDADETVNTNTRIVRNELNMRARLHWLDVSIANEADERWVMYHPEYKTHENEDELYENRQRVLHFVSLALTSETYKEADKFLTNAENYVTGIYAIRTRERTHHNSKSQNIKRSRHDEIYDGNTQNNKPIEEIVKGDKYDLKKCLSTAQSAFENGDFDKAERFLIKAERMYPSDEAKEMLKKLDEARETISGVTSNVIITNSKELTSNKRHIIPNATQLSENIAKMAMKTDIDPNKPIRPARHKKKSKSNTESNGVPTNNFQANPNSLTTENFVKELFNSLTVESKTDENKHLDRTVNNDKIYNQRYNINHASEGEIQKDAMKCVRFVLFAIYSNDIEKAVRLLNKADRMYPDAAKELINIFCHDIEIFIKHHNENDESVKLNTTNTVNCDHDTSRDRKLQIILDSKYLLNEEKIRVITLIEKADKALMYGRKEETVHLLISANSVLSILNSKENKEENQEDIINELRNDKQDKSTPVKSNTDKTASYDGTRLNKLNSFCQSDIDSENIIYNGKEKSPRRPQRPKKLLKLNNNINEKEDNSSEAFLNSITTENFAKTSSNVTSIEPKINIIEIDDKAVKNNEKVHNVRYNINNASKGELKEDAKRCVQLALSAIYSKNSDKAIRLLYKADRIYPSSVTELIKLFCEDMEILLENDVECTSNNMLNTPNTSQDTHEISRHKKIQVIINTKEVFQEDKSIIKTLIEKADKALSYGKKEEAVHLLISIINGFTTHDRKEWSDKTENRTIYTKV